MRLKHRPHFIVYVMSLIGSFHLSVHISFGWRRSWKRTPSRPAANTSRLNFISTVHCSRGPPDSAVNIKLWTSCHSSPAQSCVSDRLARWEHSIEGAAMMVRPFPPKNYKISSVFACNFRLALTLLRTADCVQKTTRREVQHWSEMTGALVLLGGKRCIFFAVLA